MTPSDRPAAETAWEAQAHWYDDRHGAEGDEHHRRVVLPAVLRHLPFKPGQLVLDCCCGQGLLARLLVAQGLQVLGIDAAPSLIAAAEERRVGEERFLVGDACHIGDQVEAGSVDHAAVVLALQDVADPAALLVGVATALRPGGRCVAVLSHPCFRVPGGSDWGFDRRGGAQYRRVDRYLRPFDKAITLAAGSTTHHHRPLSFWISAFGAAGLPLVACEELCSPKRGSAGARSVAEDAAAREFPVFLLLAGEKR
jgi:SAM-dependent methyltransferase